MGTAVGKDGKRLANALEPAPNFRRDNDQRIIIWAEKNFHQVAEGGRTFSLIVQNQFDTPERHGIVQRHFMVTVPSLDDVLVNGRKIDFTELLKVRIGSAQHVHYRSAFVGDALQRNNLNAVDHTMFTSGIGIIK